MSEKDKYETLFDEFIGSIEFELIKHPDGWGLEDLQGVNLGDIQTDRFSNASALIDRLDTYIQDYFITDLEEELEEAGIPADCPTTQELLKTAIEATTPEWRQDHQFEVDVLDMILYHAEEIDLEKCRFTDNTERPYVTDWLAGLPRDAFHRVEDYLFSEHEARKILCEKPRQE